MKIALRGVAVLVASLVVGSAWGQQSASVEDVLRALRSGGHVVVFRHGATHPDQADTDPLNYDNVAKQRHLNDKGRADAKAVGEAFRSAGVPIGKSYSSRFYRAVETARLIGGKEPQDRFGHRREPPDLQVTAKDDDGDVGAVQQVREIAVQHAELAVAIAKLVIDGVQFVVG